VGGEDRACRRATTLQLGISQLALEELREAEVSLQQALELAQRSGPASDAALAASKLAQVLLETHHYREADEKATLADELAERQGLLALRADAKGTRAMAKAGLGNTGGGLRQVEEAEEISRQMGQAERDQATLRLLSIQAAISRRAEGCSKAEKHLLSEILYITHEKPDDRARLDAYLGLARCARRLGDSGAEHDYLTQAKVLMELKEQSLRGKALAAWHRRTLPLRAAMQEAGVTGDRIPAGETYGFALLYDADGDVRAALRAAAHVPDGPYGYAAGALSRLLRARTRIVRGGSLWLRDSTIETARRSVQLPVGSWVEVMPHKGDWLWVRSERGSGYLKASNEAGVGLRLVTDGDLR
jgi:hypothetical protein